MVHLRDDFSCRFFGALLVREFPDRTYPSRLDLFGDFADRFLFMAATEEPTDHPGPSCAWHVLLVSLPAAFIWAVRQDSTLAAWVSSI
jgi:hypothetical protein